MPYLHDIITKESFKKGIDMMKRIILAIICVLMLTGLCSCDEPVLFKPIGGQTETETVNPDKPEPEAMGELSENMALEFYNKDGIRIIADSYYVEDDGDVVLMTSVVNNSDKTISVSLKYPELNGICAAEDNGWGEARKGETVSIKLDVGKDFLDYAGITTVNEFAFRYTVYNENGRTISDEKNKYICFTAGNEDYKQIIDTKGTEIIDTEDCKIIIKEHYDGKEGIDVIACFTNDSDRALKYQISNTEINGISFDVNFLDTFIEIPAYSLTYYRFTIFDSDLTRHGITADSVDTMKVSAAVYNTLDEIVAYCENQEVSF